MFKRMFKSIVNCRRRLLPGLALAVIMLAGFWVRIDSLAYWTQNPERFFFRDRQIPLDLGVDSYYYYDIAADLNRGRVRKLDERRHYPVGTEKPMALPLLPVLLALGSRVSGRAIEWVGVVISPLLGTLLALPVFFLGQRLIGGASLPWRPSPARQRHEALFAGLGAALFALFAPYYVKRTAAGWCDTDSLNVVFATLAIVMALGLAAAASRRERWLYGAGWLATTLLFVWWWDTAVVAAVGFSVLPLAVALLFTGLKAKRDSLPLLVAGVLLLTALLAWKGWQVVNPLALWRLGTSQLAYIFGRSETASVFPVLERYVGEQWQLPWRELADNVAGGWPLLLAGGFGLAALGRLAGRNILYLLPLAAVSILAFQGQRFIIFTAPLLGLGLGTLLLLLFNCCRDRRLGTLAVLAALLVAGWQLLPAAQKYNSREPVLAPELFEGFYEAASLTPADAVIWSSWGNGHPLVYYSQRKTLGDGMYHPSKLLYYQNFPMATANFRLAANWMRFCLVNGERGLTRANELFAGSANGWEKGMRTLRRLLGAGVAESRTILAAEFAADPRELEKTLAFLFPLESPPIFWFLDYKHFLAQTWYGLGAWDFGSRSEPRNMKIALSDFSLDGGETRVTGGSREGPVVFDLRTGVGSVGGVGMGLGAIKMDNGVEPRSFEYPQRRYGPVLYLTRHRGGGLGVLLDKNMAAAVFTRMLLEKDRSQNYIVPVRDRTPFYMLCRINGERYTPPE